LPVNLKYGREQEGLKSPFCDLSFVELRKAIKGRKALLGREEEGRVDLERGEKEGRPSLRFCGAK